jgi:hypothetical protein
VVTMSGNDALHTKGFCAGGRIVAFTLPKYHPGASTFSGKRQLHTVDVHHEAHTVCAIMKSKPCPSKSIGDARICCMWPPLRDASGSMACDRRSGALQREVGQPWQ